ncbi:MAG: FtsQ-type POTRA domain-containing protein [Holophagales bacterium]|nr:FtsQ-type POTRA domain-containing protein [Holophagales bacterium]
MRAVAGGGRPAAFRGRGRRSGPHAGSRRHLPVGSSARRRRRGRVVSRGATRRRSGARRPVRRRRPRPVVWLALGAGKVLLGIAPVVGVGVWLATAPVFDLELDIQIEEAERVSEQWVRSRLAPLEGRNLPLLSLEPAARRLDHEWIREAELVKRLPNELTVRVVEHQPAALFAAGDRAWVIDRDGRAIVACDRAPDLCDGDLVSVSIESALAGERPGDGPARNPGAGAGSSRGAGASRNVQGEVLARTLKRALDVAAEVRAFEWGRQVRAVEVISDDDYLLACTGRPATVLVRGSDLTAKASVFELLRNAITEHNDPEVVDLRFRDRIVLSMEAPGAQIATDTEVAAGVRDGVQAPS